MLSSNKPIKCYNLGGNFKKGIIKQVIIKLIPLIPYINPTASSFN